MGFRMPLPGFILSFPWVGTHFANGKSYAVTDQCNGKVTPLHVHALGIIQSHGEAQQKPCVCVCVCMCEYRHDERMTLVPCACLLCLLPERCECLLIFRYAHAGHGILLWHSHDHLQVMKKRKTGSQYTKSYLYVCSRVMQSMCNTSALKLLGRGACMLWTCAHIKGA